MLAAMFLPLLSLVVSFSAGLCQVAQTYRRISALAPRREGQVWIVQSDRVAPEFTACTVGLLRPRIIVSSDVRSSPAILAHEKSHARARHSLWIFLATCGLRS